MSKNKPPHSDLNKEQRRLDRAERVLQLRRAIAPDLAPKLGATDQEAVSRAVYGLLQRMQEERGISKAFVMREARLATEGDSTKHLLQYATPPHRKPARLNKKIAPYVKLAQTVARLAALDEDQTLLEVFGGASFWQSTATREASREFVELAERLRFVMGGISRKYNLAKFFSDVLNGGGVLTFDHISYMRDESGMIPPENMDLIFDFNFGPQIWPIQFYQPTEEAEDGNGDTVPVYPSIVLGTWEIGESVPVNITTQFADADGHKQEISGDVDGSLQVELQLCIVPTGQNLEATPALRVQLIGALSPLWSCAPPLSIPPEIIGGKTRSSVSGPILRFPSTHMLPLTKGVEEVRGQWSWGGGQNDFGSDANVKCEMKVQKDQEFPRLVRDYFGGGEYFENVNRMEPYRRWGAYVRFLPITGAVCEDWFGFEARANRYNRSEQRLANLELGFALAERYNWSESPSAKFKFQTIADTIDFSLCERVDGLDMLFQARAEFLTTRYDKEISAARRSRDEGWEVVQERWSTPNQPVDREE